MKNKKVSTEAQNPALNKGVVTSGANWKLVAHSYQIADTGGDEILSLTKAHKIETIIKPI